MFLFVFWIVNFGVRQIFHIIKSVIPDFKKVKNHWRNTSVRKFIRRISIGAGVTEAKTVIIRYLFIRKR